MSEAILPRGGWVFSAFFGAFFLAVAGVVARAFRTKVSDIVEPAGEFCRVVLLWFLAVKVTKSFWFFVITAGPASIAGIILAVRRASGKKVGIVPASVWVLLVAVAILWGSRTLAVKTPEGFFISRVSHLLFPLKAGEKVVVVEENVWNLKRVVGKAEVLGSVGRGAVEVLFNGRRTLLSSDKVARPFRIGR